MPKPDPNFASVAIACVGPGVGVQRSGPAGSRRSRDGARLQLVEADADYWHANYRAGSTGFDALLVNPSRDECIAAIKEAAHTIDAVRRGGGQLYFAFAGHGAPDGSLVLSDGAFSPGDLIAAIASTTHKSAPRRQLGIVLDCCYSGRALAELLTSDQHRRTFFVIDGFAAALHDEVAWEIDGLGHGALTFTMKNRGNEHVDRARLVRAVHESDEAYLRFALQAYVPNPVTYLTEGDQHSLDVLNGHHVEVKGGGWIELASDRPRLDDLLGALEWARSAAPRSSTEV